MKTIREWLEELPEPWRSSALRQANVERLEEKMLIMTYGLMRFQIWRLTDEGDEPWRALCMHCLLGTPMPKHPSEEAQ